MVNGFSNFKSIVISTSIKNILNTIINVIMALLFGELLSIISISSGIQQVINKSILLIFIVVIKYVLNLFFDRYIINITSKKQKLFKTYLYNKIMFCGSEFNKRFSISEILARMEKDFDKVVNYYTDLKGNQIALLISALVYSIVLISYNWILALIAIILCMISTVVPLIIRKKLIVNYDDYMVAWDRLFGRIRETVAGMETIKILGLENLFYKYYENESKELEKISYAEDKTAEFEKALSSGISILTQLLLFIVLGVFFHKYKINISVIVIYIYVNNLLIQVLNSLYKNYYGILESKTSIRRLKELLNYNYSDENDKGKIVITTSIKTIEIKKLHFEYDKPVLKDINCTINSGDKVIITGSNGSGKTTLIKIILGLLQNFNGEVLINGNKIDDINMKSYYSHISMLSQNDCFFFDEVDEEIKSSFGAFDGEFKIFKGEFSKFRGKNINTLSGGMKKKLSIERLISKDNDIIIMDEPTNDLDEQGVKQLIGFFNETGKTLIVVSHDVRLIPLFNKPISLKKVVDIYE